MTDHRSIRRQAEAEHAERMKRHAGGAEDARQDKEIADREIGRAFVQHDDQLHEGRKTKLKLKDGGHAEGRASRRRLDRVGHRRKRDTGGVADPGATAALSRAVDAGLAQSINQAQGHANGGRAKGGKASKASHVNVIVATTPRDRPVPVPVPAPGGMPPRPPMMGGAPPMPSGAMPPGGMLAGMPPGAGAGGMPMGLAGRPPMPGVMPGMPPVRARGGRARANGGRTSEAAVAHGQDLAISMKAGSHSGEGRLAKAKLNARPAAFAGD